MVMKKMKLDRTFFLALITLTVAGFLSGCNEIQGVNGNGNVSTEQRHVDPFSAIDVGGAFQIVLRQGDTVSLILEADENLLQHIITEVRNNQLEISTDRNIGRFEKLKAIITFKSLDEINLHGAVELWSEKSLNFNDLSIDGSGATEMEMTMTVQKLLLTLTGSSEVTLSGTAREVDSRMSGATDLKADDFETNILTMDMSGAGEADVYVTEKMDVTVTGAGDVRYRGEPQQINQNVSGAGSIEKL
jgi:hypothetical protein